MKPKIPFNIDQTIHRIREAVQPFAKAAMFDLYEHGFTTPFEQLIACMISMRTLDEVTIPTALRLFSRARTPEAMVQLSISEIDHLIQNCTFHERKAAQMHQIASRIIADYNGILPCEPDVLLSFAGIGIKCANLTLGIACGLPRISVDVHVDRVTNRWGYIHTPTPEKTTEALETVLPVEYWIEINRLLVPFGKHICTGRLPHCSSCPVLDMCQQIGVTSHL